MSVAQMSYILLNCYPPWSLVYWASDIARDEMPEHVFITLIENNEETDTADEFEVDMSCNTSTCIFQKCNMYE